ncbi:MAG TPA: thioredoxin family protein, partial [Nitrososphaera sp.]|nr:thioredoxin family protein [Nitrososphaera sp.]
MNTDNLSALAVGIGVVALITGFGIYFNNPELNTAASGDNFVPATIVENGTVTQIQIDKSQFKLAPELAQISGYINTDPVTLGDLKGKVVLVDFWTYSCINCIRTIPYLNAWHEKYADDGLVILGVHTPEFEFEKDYDNVRAAVEKFEIEYPVAQDNEKGTWKEYENRYWPRKYLVDNEGYIRYDHIGEGAYAETEKVIQSLLSERAAYIGANATIDQSISRPENAQSVNFGRIDTPELYFGYQFARAPL